MLSGKWRQRFTELCHVGGQRLSELFSLDGKSNHGDLIGLTISAEYVKLLKIQSKNSHYTVENFNMTPVPAGLVIKNDIKDPAALANIVKDIYNQSQVTSKNVACCIARSLTIVKNITVDKRFTMDEIESRVWIEANRLFPKLIDDIYLDFAVTGPSSEDASKLDILLVACRKEVINPFLEVMYLSGLNTKIIDVNYFALERALHLVAKQTPELKTLALLNIGFFFIDLIVIHEGEPSFTHEVSYDSSGIKQMIAHGTSNIADQTEMLKQNLGLLIKHIIQFFYSSRPNIRLQRIILSGDCAIALPELAGFIQSEVNKEVVLAHPFQDMEVAPIIDKEKLKSFSPALMLCCGLSIWN